MYVILAGLTGLFAPPLGPAVRAVWATLTDGVATRQRAYGFDVGVEDTLFTVGPLLVGGLVLLDGPTLALIVAAVLMLVGSVAFARSPAVAIHDERAPKRKETPLIGTLRSPGIAELLSIVLALSTCLGIVDVCVAARAVEKGTPAAAGYVLAGMTLGSVIGGELWGRRTRSGSLSTQFALLSAALSICLAGATAAPNLIILAVALVALGTVITPILVLSYVTAEKLAPKAGRTEASTWVGTSLNAGIAIGSALGGFMIVRIGSTGSFLLSTAVSATVLVFIIAFRKRLLGSLSGSTYSSGHDR
jgi:predicted MFS family arabinose efflux permease